MRYNNYILYYLLMNTYLTYVLFLAIGRALDLISTWLVSPDLQLESNQWMKKFGWKVTIIVNVFFVLLIPVLIFVGPELIVRKILIIIISFSALLAFRNLQFLPMVRSLGQAEYKEKLDRYYRESSLGIFVASLIVKNGPFFFFGIIISGAQYASDHPMLEVVGAIGQSFSVYAFFFGFMDVMSRIAAKNAKALADA